MNTQEKIEVMQAYLDGTEIRATTKSSVNWYKVVTQPEWDWVHYNYRIKPVPLERWCASVDGVFYCTFATEESAKKFIRDTSYREVRCFLMREVIE